MSDYQQIPGNIRSLLATKSQVWTEQTADLAIQYASMCDEANRRLRRCADYLHQGMWSAATHLADCQPNLMQSVTWLQFPERAAWAELCVTHGLPAPAMLETDCLEDLKAAYERERSLQPLLSRHRLLAIAKAPVRARLEVARQLASEDPKSTAWIEEVSALENARLDEIDDEAAAALRNHADDAIAALWDEVNGQTWRRQPPQAVQNQLRQAMVDIKARQAVADLEKTGAELLSTFQTDPQSPELPEKIKTWSSLIQTPAVVVPADLELQVRSILQQHSEQQRRKQAIKEAETMQQLFRPPDDAEPRKSFFGHNVIIVIAVGLLVLASAAGYFYLVHLRK